MPFVKLDCGILDSSLWVESAETRIVFLTMLALTEPSGLCPATAPGIARRANLPIESVKKAIEILETPDTESRSQESGGRRIERVDGGYYMVNYLRYRAKINHEERKEQVREAVARHRDRKRGAGVICGNQEKAMISPSTSSSASKGKGCGEGVNFNAWWKRYPRKVGKGAACNAWVARMREGVMVEDLEGALTNYLEDIRIRGTEECYIKHGATFLGRAKGFEDYLKGTWTPPPAPKTFGKPTSPRLDIESLDVPFEVKLRLRDVWPTVASSTNDQSIIRDLLTSKLSGPEFATARAEIERRLAEVAHV